MTLKSKSLLAYGKSGLFSEELEVKSAVRVKIASLMGEEYREVALKKQSELFDRWEFTIEGTLFVAEVDKNYQCTYGSSAPSITYTVSLSVYILGGRRPFSSLEELGSLFART